MNRVHQALVSLALTRVLDGLRLLKFLQILSAAQLLVTVLVARNLLVDRAGFGGVGEIPTLQSYTRN